MQAMDSYLQNRRQLSLTKNNLLTTLPILPHEWMVEFMLKPTNLESSGWTSIFHMSIAENCCNVGERIPAIFFKPSYGFRVDTALNNKAAFENSFPAPAKDKWTQIRVSQELLHWQFYFRVFIDDAEKLVVENLTPVKFVNVKVSATSPWHNAQPGFIKNLSINVKKYY